MATDEQELEHVQQIADEFYELEYPAQALGQYSVTLTSGYQVFIFTTPGGAEAIGAEGFPIHEINDDDMVTFDPSNTRYSGAELTAQPTPIYDEVASKPARRKRPRLPNQKLGQHHQADVRSLDEQRRKPARGEPTLPFGYEGTGKPTPLPRHRRRT